MRSYENEDCTECTQVPDKAACFTWLRDDVAWGEYFGPDESFAVRGALPQAIGLWPVLERENVGFWTFLLLAEESFLTFIMILYDSFRTLHGVFRTLTGVLREVL